MKIRVIVSNSYSTVTSFGYTGNFRVEGDVVREYTIDHNDPVQRRVLGEQCRNAFEGGQFVITYPVAS